MYNVDLSDQYVVLPENCVDLVDHCVELSENYVDLSDITLTSRWQLKVIIRYKNKMLSY